MYSPKQPALILIIIIQRSKAAVKDVGQLVTLHCNLIINYLKALIRT